MLGGKATNLGRPLLLAAVEEGTEQTAVEVLQHGDQEQLVELKRRRELELGDRSGGWRSRLGPLCAAAAHLSRHLPDAVNELDEERRALRVGVVLIAVTHPLQHTNASNQFFFKGMAF